MKVGPKGIRRKGRKGNMKVGPEGEYEGGAGRGIRRWGRKGKEGETEEEAQWFVKRSIV